MAIKRRAAAREVADPTYTTIRFTDGLTIDTLTCARGIHARSHWNDDGTCRCGEAA